MGDIIFSNGVSVAGLDDHFNVHEPDRNGSEAGNALKVVTAGRVPARIFTRSTGAAAHDAMGTADGKVAALGRNRPVTRTERSEKSEDTGKDCNARFLAAMVVQYPARRGTSHRANFSLSLPADSNAVMVGRARAVLGNSGAVRVLSDNRPDWTAPHA